MRVDAMDSPTDRVAVTGANGHIARRLILHLTESGVGPERILAVVRSQRAAETVAGLPERSRPQAVVVDYRDHKELTKAVQGCRFFVHTVGILKESATTRYSEAHETASFSLARAAEAVGAARIVYLSIVGADPESHNACFASKGRAEQILLTRGVPAVVLRVPMVLGPGDQAARALRARSRARFVPLVRGGVTREQPLDVEDVVRAITTCLRHPSLKDEALDLAGPENLSLCELVLRNAEMYGRRPRIIPVPLALARAFARVGEAVLANPPVTRAMLEVLEHDDRVDTGPACRRLSLELTPLEQTLERYVGPGAAAG